MNLQFFAEGDPAEAPPVEGTPAPASIDDVGQLDSYLDNLQNPDGTPPVAPEGTTPPPEGTAPDAPEDTATVPTAQSKANFTFAQMRNQIASYEALLSKVGNATGIKFDNVQDLTTKLNDDALTRLAQQQNVPVELMRKLEMLEQDSNNWKQAQLKESALAGFQNLMTKFELTQEELNQFAIELDEADMNPFNKAVDVEATYISKHYQEVLNKQVQTAVQEALKQSQVADAHSTTPNTNTGAPSSPDAKVTTVHQLNNFLDSLGK